MDSMNVKRKNLSRTRKNTKNSPMNKKNEQEAKLEALESNLEFLGCVGETKVIRKDSRDLIQSFVNAGVRVSIASSGPIN
jgi:magnesium-transporting ATPase (P-type)